MAMPPETVLYIDTTSSRLMLGISRNQVMLATYEQPCESHRYHSALMTPAIQDLLAQAGLRVGELQAIAVNHGPGSFTGLRTGIITTRTMAQFLHMPVYVFNTFELLAYQHLAYKDVGEAAAHPTNPVSIYLNALRGKSYHACLHYTETGPQYLQEPSLQVLDLALSRTPSSQDATTIASPPICIEPTAHPCEVLVAPALQAIYPHPWTALVDETTSTPALMGALLQRYPAYFQRPWQEVRPLYLQEPSITLPASRLAQE